MLSPKAKALGQQPAFPIAMTTHSLTKYFGLTKREHFACEAMKGILSNSHMVDGLYLNCIKYASEGAVSMANGLLEQLAKEEV